MKKLIMLLVSLSLLTIAPAQASQPAAAAASPSDWWDMPHVCKEDFNPDKTFERVIDYRETGTPAPRFSTVELHTVVQFRECHTKWKAKGPRHWWWIVDHIYAAYIPHERLTCQELRYFQWKWKFRTATGKWFKYAPFIVGCKPSKKAPNGNFQFQDRPFGRTMLVGPSRNDNPFYSATPWSVHHYYASQDHTPHIGYLFEGN